MSRTRVEVGRSELLGASWGERVLCESPVVYRCPQPPARSPRAPSRAFRLQPVEALEMNFAISSEMTQVRGRRGRKREGGVGKMVVVRGVPLSRGKRVPRGSLLAQLPVRVGRARWSGTSLRRGGDRQASARGGGGPWDLAPRVARKGDPPEGSGGGHHGAWASSPAVSSGSRLRVGTPRAKTSRGPRVGTRSRPP